LHTNQSADDGAPGWRELTMQCEVMQAAAAIAWGNMIEAYKVAAANPAATLSPDEALTRYRTARTMQLAAEQALVAYFEARRYKDE
jgi:hypothetical protein